MRYRARAARPYVTFCLVAFIACSAFAHGPIHEQIAAVTQQIQQQPQNAKLYLKRGELHRIHGEPELAFRDYARAEELAPELPGVALARGKLYFDQKRYDEAKRALDRLIERDPGSVEGIILRARTLAALGAHSEAVGEWQRGEKLTPNPSPEFFLGWADAVEKAGKNDEALAVLDRGIARLGSLVTLELAAVELELQRKHYDGALGRLDRVAAQSERKETYLTRKGEILLLAERRTRACEAFEQASRSLDRVPDARRHTRVMIALEARIAAGRKRCS